MSQKVIISIDLEILPCSECRILSFGWFPDVLILCADVSEHSVCSIWILCADVSEQVYSIWILCADVSEHSVCSIWICADVSEHSVLNLYFMCRRFGTLRLFHLNIMRRRFGTVYSIWILCWRFWTLCLFHLNIMRRRFGTVYSIWILCADVSEHSACSIWILCADVPEHSVLFEFCVLAFRNIVYIPSESYAPTFPKTLFHLHRQCKEEDGTDKMFRNIGA
jgi:hypothetical protein